MAAPIAELFATIGFKVNTKELDRFQKRLGHVKAQLQSIQKSAKIRLDTRDAGLKATIAKTRELNKELTAVKRKAKNPIVVRARTQQTTGAARKAAGGGNLPRLGLESVLPGFGVAGTSFFAARGLIRTQSNIDSLKNALEFATGSTKVAASEFNFLEKEADRLGFTLSKVGKAYSLFAAATSKDVNISLETTREVFTSVAEAATVMGLSADDTEGVMRALTQMVSKGKVQAEELRGQLGERLPGAFQAAAEGMGLTTEELNKQLELGNVYAKDLLPALAKQLDIQIQKSGALQTAQQKLRFSVGLLDRAWEKFQQDLSESGTSEAFADLFTRIAAILRNNSNVTKLFGKGIKGVIEVFNLLARGIEITLFWLDGILEGWKGLLDLLPEINVESRRLKDILTLLGMILRDGVALSLVYVGVLALVKTATIAWNIANWLTFGSLKKMVATVVLTAGIMWSTYVPSIITAATVTGSWAAATLAATWPILAIGAAVIAFAASIFDLYDFLSGNDSVLGSLATKAGLVGTVFNGIAGAAEFARNEIADLFQLIDDVVSGDAGRGIGDFLFNTFGDDSASMLTPEIMQNSIGRVRSAAGKAESSVNGVTNTRSSTRNSNSVKIDKLEVKTENADTFAGDFEQTLASTLNFGMKKAANSNQVVE